MVDRRVAGVPLEHVLGWAEFRGLRVAVDPGVFVPRRRTEFLVAAGRRPGPPGRRGAGPVLRLRRGRRRPSRPGWPTSSCTPRTSIRPRCACARRNIAAVGGRVYEGDLFGAAARPGSAAGSTSWSPTSPTCRPGRSRLLPPEARDHEPRAALDGGPDGLDVARRVVAGAPGWLAPGGWLLFETSERQAPVATDAGACRRSGRTGGRGRRARGDRGRRNLRSLG